MTITGFAAAAATADAALFVNIPENNADMPLVSSSSSFRLSDALE